MPTRKPPTDPPAPLSMAWRCVNCGTYHLQDEPLPQPAACGQCGGVALAAAGPRPSLSDDDPDSEAPLP